MHPCLAPRRGKRAAAPGHLDRTADPFSRRSARGRQKLPKVHRVLRMLTFGWIIIALGVAAMLWADGNFTFSRG